MFGSCFLAYAKVKPNPVTVAAPPSPRRKASSENGNNKNTVAIGTLVTENKFCSKKARLNDCVLYRAIE